MSIYFENANLPSQLSIDSELINNFWICPQIITLYHFVHSVSKIREHLHCAKNYVFTQTLITLLN